jgi:hypothetical protein
MLRLAQRPKHHIHRLRLLYAPHRNRPTDLDLVGPVAGVEPRCLSRKALPMIGEIETLQRGLSVGGAIARIGGNSRPVAKG